MTEVLLCKGFERSVRRTRELLDISQSINSESRYVSKQRRSEEELRRRHFVLGTLATRLEKYEGTIRVSPYDSNEAPIECYEEEIEADEFFGVCGTILEQLIENAHIHSVGEVMQQFGFRVYDEDPYVQRMHRLIYAPLVASMRKTFIASYANPTASTIIPSSEAAFRIRGVARCVY